MKSFSTFILCVWDTCMLLSQSACGGQRTTCRLFSPSGSNIKLKLLSWQGPLRAEPLNVQLNFVVCGAGDGTWLCAVFMSIKLSTTDVLSSPPSLFLFLFL